MQSYRIIKPSFGPRPQTAPPVVHEEAPPLFTRPVPTPSKQIASPPRRSPHVTRSTNQIANEHVQQCQNRTSKLPYAGLDSQRQHLSYTARRHFADFRPTPTPGEGLNMRKVAQFSQHHRRTDPVKQTLPEYAVQQSMVARKRPDTRSNQSHFEGHSLPPAVPFVPQRKRVGADPTPPPQHRPIQRKPQTSHSDVLQNTYAGRNHNPNPFPSRASRVEQQRTELTKAAQKNFRENAQLSQFFRARSEMSSPALRVFLYDTKTPVET